MKMISPIPRELLIPIPIPTMCFDRESRCAGRLWPIIIGICRAYWLRRTWCISRMEPTGDRIEVARTATSDSRGTVVDPQDLAKACAELFGVQPRIFRAPGRVNLIGEHTDYNEGFVMPAAINYSTFVAMAPREDRIITVRSDHFPDTAELNLDCPTQSRKDWSDYPLGVAVKLEEAGQRLKGANLFIHGDVPVGAGLSSSAAIEVS